MSWIRLVRPEDARGDLRLSYDAAQQRAGRVFHIVRAMSQAPKVLDASMGLYLAIMFAKGGLTRHQRELLAVVVSSTNSCHY